MLLKSNVYMCLAASAPLMTVPPQNMTILDGQDATISCRAGGAPQPNVTWLYNGMIKGLHFRKTIKN